MRILGSRSNQIYCGRFGGVHGGGREFMVGQRGGGGSEIWLIGGGVQIVCDRLRNVGGIRLRAGLLYIT